MLASYIYHRLQNTNGGPLQCIDTLRRRFSLPGFMVGDIGGGCNHGKSTARSMNMIDVLEWISNTVEDSKWWIKFMLMGCNHRLNVYGYHAGCEDDYGTEISRTKFYQYDEL
mgnify:FL=1